MIKADLHIHTSYSFDCVSKLQDIIARCLKTGINCIAVADHGTVEGALKMQKIAPFKVIAAEEIMTRDGEVMGMFLKKTIPNKISLNEAISRIREQNGLVCIPHPFDRPNRHGLGRKMLEQIKDEIDIVEIFNARSPLPRFSSSARAFAAKYDKCASAGSDAHTLREIGATYIEMPEFEGKPDFLEKLREGEIRGRMTNLFVMSGGIIARIRKRAERSRKVDC